MKKKTPQNAVGIIRLIDEKNLQVKAVEALEKILDDPTAKRSEVLSAADKIIKIRLQYQDVVRRQAMDSLELEIKQITLEEKRINLEKLTGIRTVGGEESESDNRSLPYSRPFEPSMKPDDVTDEILVTG